MNLAGAVLAGVERTLVPLDVLRRATYRVFVPWLGAWIRERDVRVAVNGALVAVSSLVLAAVFPLGLLALGPLVLGVPHLLADVRYLVARPGLHRRSGAIAVVVMLLLSSVTLDLRWGLAAAMVVPLLARGTIARRIFTAAAFACLLAASFLAHRGTLVVIAHIHNVVAVVLWALLASALHQPTGRSRRIRWVPLACIVAGSAVILGGALDGWAVWELWGAPSLRYHMQQLAPGLEPVWATRWVVAFAYAQAVHYGLWLRVVPEEGRHRPSPRSWRASLDALRRDVGDGFMASVVVVAVVLALWGLADLTAAREGYLRLALFHGPLEFVVLGLVLVEGRSVLRA